MNLQHKHALSFAATLDSRCPRLLFVLLLMLPQGCSVPQASQDDAVSAKCPNIKPHKCPPSSTCYGQYQYCSSASKTVEPCINETILENLDIRKKQCQYIAQGQNVTKLIRHWSCKVEEDCRAEFTALFLPSAQDDDTSWKWILPTCICLVLIAILVLVFFIWYCRKKATKNRLDKEQSARMLANNNSSSTVAISRNNRINENIQEDANQRQEVTDAELGDTDNTELMAHVRGDTNAAGNAHNSPDSGITPYSTAVTINIDSSSGSGSNRNSTHSSGNSSASIGSDPQEENLRRPVPNGTQNGHPADFESSRHRSIHLPSSEPHGSAQIVTNQTIYDPSNNGDLE